MLYANTTRLGTSGLAYEDVELGAGAPVHPTEMCGVLPSQCSPLLCSGARTRACG